VAVSSWASTACWPWRQTGLGFCSGCTNGETGLLAVRPKAPRLLPLLRRDESRAGCISLVPRRAMPTPHGPNEFYSKKAREEGKLARSYFKLEQMDKRLKLLQRGHKVVDLGCWPGAWTRYAAERVGPKGRVLGIDLVKVTAQMPGNVKTVNEDAFEFFRRKTPELDVVLSDMAPKPVGEIRTDHGRSVQLVELAMGIADAKLKVGGSVLMKIWDGAETQDLLQQLKLRYEVSRILRPKATRSQSNEIYLLGQGKLPMKTLSTTDYVAPSHAQRGVAPPSSGPQRGKVQEDYSGW